MKSVKRNLTDGMMHRYNNSKTTKKNTMDDSLQLSETILNNTIETEWQ